MPAEDEEGRRSVRLGAEMGERGDGDLEMKAMARGWRRCGVAVSWREGID